MSPRYSAPIIVLAGLVLCGVALLNRQSKRFEVAKADIVSAENAVADEQAAAEDLQQQKARAQLGYRAVEAFLAEWSLHAQEAGTVGPIVEQLSRLSTERSLLNTRKPTPMNEDYPFGGGRAIVQKVGFAVTGSYLGVLEWLGAVETSFPYARLDSVIMRGRGNEVEMEIMLVFLISEKPEIQLRGGQS